MFTNIDRSFQKYKKITVRKENNSHEIQKIKVLSYNSIVLNIYFVRQVFYKGV